MPNDNIVYLKPAKKVFCPKGHLIKSDEPGYPVYYTIGFVLPDKIVSFCASCIVDLLLSKLEPLPDGSPIQ